MYSKAAITLGLLYRGRVSDGNDTLQTGNAVTTDINYLYGEGGNDALTGSFYTDILIGGDGDDTMNGNNGNDTYIYTAGLDTITDGSGLDTVHIGLSSVEAHDISFSASGNNLKMIINATTDEITLTQQELSTSKIDYVTFEDGFRASIGNTSNPWIWGTSGNDTITLTSGQLTLIGGNGDDTLTGYLGNSSIHGGDGNDTITDDSGADNLHGGAGNDNISGGGGNDLIYGGLGNDTVDGGNNNDVISGGAGDDTLYGGLGIDTIYGGDDDDTLYGQDGLDSLWGNLGADTFVFEDPTAYNNVDVIKDFNTGEGDILNIADLLTAYDPMTDAITDFVQITDDSTDSTLSIDQDGTGGTYSWTAIATIEGVTGITDEAALVSAGNLIVT